MKTPLHVAIQTRDLQVTQALLQHGAEVNAKKKNLQTPVHLAALCGNPDILRALLHGGGQVNTKDDRQKTPLHRYFRHLVWALYFLL